MPNTERHDDDAPMGACLNRCGNTATLGELCRDCEEQELDAWMERQLAEREAQADGDWLREWQTDHELGLV